jgi:uncharacterized protein
MPKTLHLEKKAIRALGVAESFRPKDEISTLAGVVMRSDLVVDGFGVGELKVSGSDSTSAVIRLFRNLKRNDINAVLLSGSVLSLYNVVDIDELYSKLELPIVALSFKKSTADLAENIRLKFSKAIASEKIELLEKLGKPERLRLSTGYEVFVRASGIQGETTKKLLNRFTTQGAVPEPIRVSRMLARTVASFVK